MSSNREARDVGFKTDFRDTASFQQLVSPENFGQPRWVDLLETGYEFRLQSSPVTIAQTDELKTCQRLIFYFAVNVNTCVAS